MKGYDVIAIGSGSAMNIVSQILSTDPDKKIALIEKDMPGGICLTRGCIPSKRLLYPATVIHQIKRSNEFGISVDINKIDFSYIMKQMRHHVKKQSDSIKEALIGSNHIDFYPYQGRFIDDYTLQVKDKRLRGENILICSGSRPSIPPIKGIKDIDYLTSKTFLNLKDAPESMAIIGGGYIAAEYGFFLSMMGVEVTIIGRNPQFVPSEEPEISKVLKDKLSKHMSIVTGYEVKEVYGSDKSKTIFAKDKKGDKKEIKAAELLVVTGRESNSDILKPERSGVETDENGWIKVNPYLETTKENIWAMGDAVGEPMFKHVANMESEVVYRNAFEANKIKMDYHAVPHAIFTEPEVASVGLKEDEARKMTDILIGHQRYQDTAKGDAMGITDCFVKVIVEKDSYRILGAHIVGPNASILIQEIVNLMYTEKENILPIYRGMHIHPALSEVVERAFYGLHSHDHHTENL